MRVVIADDETLALGRLAELLGQIGGVEVVASVESGEDAIRAIESLRPDLAILDIEMPKVDGFDVVEAIAGSDSSRPGPPPLMAFVTAYPQFALQAFDTGALDFLCKPVRLERLQQMIERAQRSLVQREARARLVELGGNLAGLRRRSDVVDERCFWVRDKGEIVRIGTAEVEWIEAEGPCTRLHLSGRSYLLRSSIGGLARDLSAEGYVRVHRSAIVNWAQVKRVNAGRSATTVMLHSGLELPVGRKFRSAVRKNAEPRDKPRD